MNYTEIFDVYRLEYKFAMDAKSRCIQERLKMCYVVFQQYSWLTEAYVLVYR